MGMVEKVAKRLEPQAWAALGTGDTLAYKNRRTSSLRKARAAIEAMREPTEEMIDAGIEAKMKLYERLEDEGKNTRIIVVANHPAGTIYQAMIDKALESGE